MFMMMYFSFYENLELRFKFLNAGMPDCPAAIQSGTGMKKTNGAGTSIFLFLYRTEIIDAGILMPALVSSMPMPSFHGKAPQ
jgi:hypothetical protein